MQLTFDSDVEEFRAEFAAFLDEHLPSDAETGAADIGVAHAAVGARLAAAAVRQRLAAAGPAAGVRRPQRDRAAAVRPPRRAVPAPDLPQLQPAGRQHRCGVADFVRLRRAEAPLGQCRCCAGR